MKKQLSYADSRKIPFVAVIGEDELVNNMVTLKNMQTGEQQKIKIDDFISIF